MAHYEPPPVDTFHDVRHPTRGEVEVKILAVIESKLDAQTGWDLMNAIQKELRPMWPDGIPNAK